MQATAFRIQMYRCILDSDWVEVAPLTALVGKNESGKTTLLRALHKFNPFEPDPYVIRREWPKGHRDKRSKDQIVCTVRFKLTKDELTELAKLTEKEASFEELEISKNYAGEFEVHFPDERAD